MVVALVRAKTGNVILLMISLRFSFFLRNLKVLGLVAIAIFANMGEIVNRATRTTAASRKGEVINHQLPGTLEAIRFHIFTIFKKFQ